MSTVREIHERNIAEARSYRERHEAGDGGVYALVVRVSYRTQVVRQLVRRGFTTFVVRGSGWWRLRAPGRPGIVGAAHYDPEAQELRIYSEVEPKRVVRKVRARHRRPPHISVSMPVDTWHLLLRELGVEEPGDVRQDLRRVEREIRARFVGQTTH